MAFSKWLLAALAVIICGDIVFSEGNCPELYTAYSDVTCVRIVDLKLKWEAAQRLCFNQGDLVVIKDNDFFKFLKGFLSAGTSYWIGLHDPGRDGHFKWVGEQEDANYTKWKAYPRGPTLKRHCVEMVPDQNGLWNDKNCGYELSSVCQSPYIVKKKEVALNF